jgi:helix-turn-helix protein
MSPDESFTYQHQPLTKGDAMKTQNYANAKDVLPPELLEQVREHFTGNLYIPGKDEVKPRTELIITLAKSGADTAEIARIAGVSTRRVNQVISKKRRRTWEWIE